ncbi:hypothetical protein pipiens_002933 [Culex pipiens pipiens]|uniref:Uncharacterized protein n=1 Tax=Culex pipiens pipiens TaxID=38569 RepID=A0ABD1D938_CULPP
MKRKQERGAGSAGKNAKQSHPGSQSSLLAANKYAPLAMPEVEKKEKMPPFYVRGVNGDLKAELDVLIKRGLKASIKLCTEGYKVIVPSQQHFNAVEEYLRQKNAQYFTHDIPAKKPFKVVLRGLYDMGTDELNEYLTQLGLKKDAAPNPADFPQFQPPRPRFVVPNLQPLPLNHIPGRGQKQNPGASLNPSTSQNQAPGTNHKAEGRPIPPGFRSFAQVTNQSPNAAAGAPSDNPEDGLYTANELFALFQGLIQRLQGLKTQKEQFPNQTVLRLTGKKQKPQLVRSCSFAPRFFGEKTCCGNNRADSWPPYTDSTEPASFMFLPAVSSPSGPACATFVGVLILRSTFPAAPNSALVDASGWDALAVMADLALAGLP